MILVWSGKGWVVPLANFIAFFAYAMSLTPFQGKHLSVAQDFGVHAATCMVFGAMAVWAIRRLSLSAKKAKSRVLIDADTGQKVVLRKSAGRFFGIPTANWVLLSGVLWGVIAIAGVAGGELR